MKGGDAEFRIHSEEGESLEKRRIDNEDGTEVKMSTCGSKKWRVPRGYENICGVYANLVSAMGKDSPGRFVNIYYERSLFCFLIRKEDKQILFLEGDNSGKYIDFAVKQTRGLVASRG